MGEHNLKNLVNEKIRSDFIQHLINDIEALEKMLKKNLIESGNHRIGAEQEFCLVNENWRPAKNSGVILNAINDNHFTTELAQYNLEINLDPFELKGDCFQKVSKQLNSLLKKAKNEAEIFNSKIVLTGILPTISKTELELDFLTPQPRYWALNNLLTSAKGADFRMYIKGVEELSISHASVLFEACNTSFQLHLQISPEDFISSYNWAQAISGPIMSITTNSPLLIGRELWCETRIALFQQSIDIRRQSYVLKDQEPRVSFGKKWATGSIAEIFKDDIAQHKIILTKEISSDSLNELKNGGIPKLQALNLHNGTVYRWNRPCYGTSGGKAHVRIENRYIPAGPSTLDEMANFALWVGLMIGRPSEFDDMSKIMDFRDAKSNFIKASRTGRESILIWKGKPITANELLSTELLPIAHEGLKKAKVNDGDRLQLLGIIEDRLNGQTGSEWITKNYRFLKNSVRKDNALRLITRAMYKNQKKNIPVHRWPKIKKEGYLKQEAHLVSHIMTTELYTVQEHDLANLATQLMLWKKIHHMPVENGSGKLTGLLTWTHIQKFKNHKNDNSKLKVTDIMQKNVIVTTPRTEITDAIKTMKKNEIGCLPVVDNKDLVGIITIKDVISFDND
ncbi:MAG: CBS domain-containing protein [Aequorivita sp.]|nr:CBS domain-containing protein [Aequorivita sp.]